MSVFPNQTHQATIIKIFLLGESNVGKTSLVTRYAQDKFDAESNLLTVGIDIRKINKKFENKQIIIELWDTAGQEKYKAIPKQYIRSVQGIFLVYDITDGESFLKIQDWIQKIEEDSDISLISTILIGNKLDLKHRREVNFQEAKKFAELRGMKILETSAKQSTNVEQMIEQMVKSVFSKGTKCTVKTVKLEDPPKKNKKASEDSCC